MNITEELNQIIIKYQLDRYYPRFRMKLQAEKIIEEIILGIEDKAHIIFVGNSDTEVDYTKNLVSNYRRCKGYILIDSIDDQAMWNELKRADKVYWVSFHNMEKAIEILEEHQLVYENMYDIFLRRGLVFEDDFFYLLANNYMDFPLPGRNSPLWKRRGSCQIEYFSLNMRYKKTKNSMVKKELLGKMLFLTLYMKNFVEAKKCVQEIMRNETNEKVEAAWSEITALLDEIKQRLLQRKYGDVVWFWMDNVSYDKADNMVYLNRMKEQSISFSNAFTNTPYTNTTLRAIFCQKRNVAEQAYNISNIDCNSSAMFAYLTENSYHVKIISKYFIKHFAENNKLEFYDSASINFWAILDYLMSIDEKCFILAHALIETHTPYLSFKMCSFNNNEEMADWGKQELDEQLEFYSSFLGRNVMRIFMSDHGWQGGDFLASHHIHLDAYHSAIKPRKIDGMFSVLDFYPLIRQLIEKKEVDSETFQREFIPIENLDRYNRTDIEAIFKSRQMDLIHSFGYLGVISKDELYVRFSVGNEYQHNRNNSNWRPLLYLKNGIENDKNLEILRQEAGVYPLGILEEDKFKYSRYLHKLYEAYCIKSQKFMEALNTYLSAILLNYEDDSVTIRTGGSHSYYLYAILSEDNQRKIGGFIDYDTKCLCQAYGKKIISRVSQVDEKVKLVILSSYLHRDKLKEETEEYPKHVKAIDIYDVFEKMGCHFKGAFFEEMGLQEEDYDRVYKP